MSIQVFGTKKCRETQKLERFLKERNLSYHFVDLAQKGISPGELESVALCVGKESLLNTEGQRYKDAGLNYIEHDPIEKALDDPLLLRTPILREGKRAVIGGGPEDWKIFVSAT